MNVTKPFDKEALAKYDGKAKRAVVAYLTKHKRAAVINTWDEYGVDVFEYPDRWHEVEVKAVWRAGQEWPPSWTTLHLAARKARLFDDVVDKLTFWALRDDLEAAVIVAGDVVIGSPIEKVDNQLVKKDEPFFLVPFDRCRIVILGL